ncbi:hypothetical protein CPT_Moonbeam24 [Bacillus phage Moonbeam]|uniref:Uncharacterized protein n=1 Tax=Bacillus phage Moonbeam TaxID=1540091 RepID=A0A0A0RN30_9CAUD|nr:hypothetical protein CPT_Moonbeam24 [Bacillus phage Moonbeam]AIW03422.1 hypothetical protein CPT_Moonbeam24 [Bacillus phage Moonbeam]
MSVNQHNYILIGAKVDPSIVTEEVYESNNFEMLNWASQHKTGELTYLYDGMNGEYFIVGVPLHVDHYSENGLPLFEYTDKFDYTMYAHKVKEHVKATFNQEVKPTLIVLTHYT